MISSIPNADNMVSRIPNDNNYMVLSNYLYLIIVICLHSYIVPSN